MLTISLLTPFALQQDGQPLVLASRRTEALFVYLLRTGQPQARDVLVNLFWDDLPQVQATGNLRVLIANLNKAVGASVTITRQSIAFNARSIFGCDLGVLEQCLADARSEQSSKNGLTQLGAGKLAQALAGYQGEMLPGFYLRGGQGFEEWLATERESLRTRVIEGLGDLTSAYLRLGDYRAGIEQAQRLIKLDPLREDGHRQLMQLLAADGQPGAALTHYQRCVHILDAEMAVRPSLATTQLFQQIQSGIWKPSTPPAVAQSAAPATAHNLPREMTPFVGRAAEIARLIHYVLDPAYPLVTLTGEGGSGKTRLALRVMRHLLDLPDQRFGDGIWFVSLAELVSNASTIAPDSTAVLELLARLIGNAIRITFQSGQPLHQQLQTYLQDKAILLLLDDFGPLLNTSAVDYLLTLLQQVPQLQLLMTSPAPLDLNSEVVVRVAGLPVPTATEPAMLSDSVRLFVQHAQRGQGEFQLADQLADVVAICRFVSGLPLGIELAASRAATMSCADILSAFSTNSDVLASTRRDVPARQRSMRAVFDTSWDLLGAAEKLALAKLIVFEGTFTTEAAMHVLEVEAGAIERLARRSLLQDTGDERYRLHDLVRRFSADRQAGLPDYPAFAEAAANRHAHYYLQLWEQVESSLRKVGSRQVLDDLRQDQANLQAAWQHALAHRDWVALADSLDGILQFYHRSSLFQEGKRLVESALYELPMEIDAPLILRARLLVAEASFDEKLGLNEAALVPVQRALTLAQSLGDQEIAARAQMTWALALYGQGAYQLALPHAQAAFEQAHAAGHTHLQAATARVVGWIQLHVEDYDAAQPPLEMAHRLYMQLQDPHGEMVALNSLGVLARRRGQYEDSERYYTQALRLCRAVEDIHSEAMLLSNLGMVCRIRYELSRARNYYDQALDIFRRVNTRYNIEVTIGELAMVALVAGDYPQAQSLFEEALALSRAIGDTYGQSMNLSELGVVARAQANAAAACRLTQDGLEIAVRDGNKGLQATALLALADGRLDQGELAEAEARYQQAFDLYQLLKRSAAGLVPLAGLAEIDLRRGELATALARVNTILSVFDGNASVAQYAPLEVHHTCYRVLQAAGDLRDVAVLSRAHTLLEARASAFEDDAGRQRFIAGVATHRQIAELAAALAP